MPRYSFSIVDGRKLRTFISTLDRVITEWTVKVPEIIEKYDKLFLEDGKFAIDHVVDAFYEDYTPNVYERNEDLYHTYKLYIENGDWFYDFGPQYMQAKHHQSNEYIYENSFVNGYHGGETDGEDHPNPGEPWWKALPTLKYWLAPAEQFAESPYYLALDEIQNVIEDLRQKKIAECTSLINSGVDAVKQAFFNMFKY